MKTPIVITTGGLGSDNTIFAEYNIRSGQGMARVRYWADFLSKQHGGATVYVYTRSAWREDRKPFIVY